jgi:hypothetical protein
MSIPDSEQDPLKSNGGEHVPMQPVAQTDHPRRKSTARLRNYSATPLVLVAFVFGLGTGYLLWGPLPTRTETNPASVSSKQTSLPNQINPPNGYTLPASFRDIGPQLLAAGAIDYNRFVQVYERAGRPLTEEQLAILTKGSDAPIVINRENAYFLLNFSWALGLTNRNPLLEKGQMTRSSRGQIERFASTGGWEIAAKPVTALFASTPIATLTREQQARLEQVASAVYRPCCNNPTSFPDCNHGMALLGLLELMASQDASVDEMFTAAKYINAFWFPQQTLELAIYFKATQGLDFAKVDARQIVGTEFSSGTGFQKVHQWLATNGLLEQAPNNGNSCGV